MKTASLLVLVLSSACLMMPRTGANSSGGNSAYDPNTGGGGGGGGGGGAEPATGPAPSSSSPAPHSAPAAPAGPVSVTIRSACSKQVKVFYGDKPKFGSGTYSSIDSNSVQSHSFRPGEMLWVVDEHENGLGSATISANTRELEITSSCSGVSAR